MSDNTLEKASVKVLVADDDLFFAVKVESTLAKMGYEPKVVASAEAALEYAGANELALVILNFGRERLEPLKLTAALKKLSGAAPILGFISHGKIPEMRPLSREAGCDLLIANSVVAMRLPQMISKLAPLDGGATDLEAATLEGMEGE